MSLRAKLVLLVLGLTTALLGGLGLYVKGSLRTWTLEVVDAELEHRARVVAAELKWEHGVLAYDDDEDPGARQWPWRVETAEGEVLLSSGAAWPAGALPSPGLATLEGQGATPLRILTRQVFEPRRARHDGEQDRGRQPTKRESRQGGRREREAEEDAAEKEASTATPETTAAAEGAEAAEGSADGEDDELEEEPERRAPLLLRVAAPLGAFSGLAERFRTGLLVALLLAAVLSALGAAVVATLFLRPLERLTRDADGLGAAKLEGRLPTEGLGPELSTLARAFNGVLARLAEAFSAQRAFVGRASHALRTPLASILSQAEVALLRERSPEAYRTALQDIAASARDSARLADGLLALTRADSAERGEVKTRVALDELAVELSRLFSPRAEVAGLTLTCEATPGLTLGATRGRLRESLDALLDNALRYTPRGGAVLFEARAEGAEVVLEVRDTGPGIRPEEREQVFERFFRGSAAERSGQPGSGLGLSVVKTLAEAEGARVLVDEAPGGGARVQLRYPGR